MNLKPDQPAEIWLKLRRLGITSHLQVISIFLYASYNIPFLRGPPTSRRLPTSLKRRTFEKRHGHQRNETT